MSSSTAAILYSLTVSVPPVSAGPDEAKDKSHHVASGFVNPWE